VYSGTADSLAKGRKQRKLKIEAQELRVSGLRFDLSQHEMRQCIETLQHQEKLRDLAGRPAKLEAEAVVLPTVTGTVIGMEAERGAERIMVKPAVATTKEGTHATRK
jgi:hypothetical protein